MTRVPGPDAFQSRFEAVFGPVADAHGMRRRAGRRLCWQHGQGPLSMAFDFALNAKTAPFRPGEFALTISLPGNSNHPLASIVSLFQYLREDEADGWVAVETRALARAIADAPELAAEFPAPPERPAPNVSRWCHFADLADVERWAQWYAAVVPAFIPRYRADPETLEDWCRRVLWPRSDRHGGAA